MRDEVFRALDNAIANGYPMSDLSAEDMAVDLADYDADLGGVSTDELIPHIMAWYNSAH